MRTDVLTVPNQLPTRNSALFDVGGSITAPTTNEHYWTLAKHQRGAWNPSLDGILKRLARWPRLKSMAKLIMHRRNII